MGHSNRSSTSSLPAAFVQISVVGLRLVIVPPWWHLSLVMNYPCATMVAAGPGSTPTMHFNALLHCHQPVPPLAIEICLICIESPPGEPRCVGRSRTLLLGYPVALCLTSSNILLLISFWFARLLIEVESTIARRSTCYSMYAAHLL